MGTRAKATAICGDIRSECYPERVCIIDIVYGHVKHPIPQAGEKLSKLSP